MRRLAIAALCLVWSAHAAAAPSETEKAAAKALFDQGRTLGKSGQWTEACPKLAESQRLDPGIGTLYNLADCHEHVGKIATAWLEFGEVADLAKQAGQAEREKIARSRVQALNGRLARVELKKSGPLPDKADIHLDGKAIGVAIVDTPIPIDPGEHRLAVVTPDKTVERTFIVLDAPGTTTIELPSVEPTTPAAGPVVEPPPPRPRPASSGSWHRPVAIGLGATGLAALGASTFLGFRARGQWTDAEPQCPNDRCTAQGFTAWEEAKDTAMIGNIVFAAGIGLAAAAVVVWLLEPSTPKAAAR